jgi:hypothetical protein
MVYRRFLVPVVIMLHSIYYGARISAASKLLFLGAH